MASEVKGEAAAIVGLKSWSEWMKTELRTQHKLSVNEANLAVKKAIIHWGYALNRDIQFDIDCVRREG